MLNRPLAIAILVAAGLASPASAGLFGSKKPDKSARKLVRADQNESGDEVLVPIRNIEILGNQNVSREVILLAVASKVGEDYDREQLEKDVKAVQELGYFSHVDSQIVPFEGGLKVLLRVVENPVIDRVVITGNTLITTEDLTKLLDIKTGTTLNINQLQDGIRAVNGAYTKKDYAFAGIMSDKQFEIDPRTSTLKIDIVEPKLGKIVVTGNLKTRKHVVTREMTIKEGEFIRVEDVKNSMRDVYNLGFFEDISPPRPKFDMEKKTVDLTFDVKEQKTGTASFGGGYSSISGLIGFVDVAESNFRGLGQTIRGKWQFGGEDSYIFSFVEPWFLDRPVSLGGSVFRTRLDREQFDLGANINRFREERSGFSIVGGWRIARDTRLTASFNDESIELDSNIAARGSLQASLPRDVQFFDTDGDGKVTFDEQTLGIAWTKDTRDNFVNPSSGNRLSFSFSTTGGILKGINGYNKYIAEYRHYEPLRMLGGSVLAGRVRGGITHLTEGQLRFIDLYFLGGGDTVRGFQDREFAGEDFVLGTLELRKTFSRIFGMTAFFDVGDAFNAGRSLDLNSAVGIGARIVTPLGPFRLDYGIPISEDRTGRLHFGIGQSF